MYIAVSSEVYHTGDPEPHVDIESQVFHSLKDAISWIVDNRRSHFQYTIRQSIEKIYSESNLRLPTDNQIDIQGKKILNNMISKYRDLITKDYENEKVTEIDNYHYKIIKLQ